MLNVSRIIKQVVAIAFWSTALWSAPITFQFTGAASGTIGAASFVDTPFSILARANTDTLHTLPFGRLVVDTYSAAISIAGIGSADFTEATHLRIGPAAFTPEAFVTFEGQPFILFGIQSPFLVGWEFGESVGPLTATFTIWNVANVLQTNNGLVNFQSATNGTFTAIVVPEPASWMLTLFSLLVLTVYRVTKLSGSPRENTCDCKPIRQPLAKSPASPR